MSDSNPIFKSIRDSSGMRLAVLFGSFFFMLVFVSIINAGIVTLPGSARTHSLVIAAIQCVLAFCLPAFFLAKFSSDNWKSWLKLTKPPHYRALIGVIIVYVISMPAMEWLIEWNNNVHLPQSMSALENTLRQWEETNASTSDLLLDAHGFFPVLAGVIVIGILTGFSEELFFRGGLQGIFSRSNIGISISVWLAAIVFSTMHFQFFGFFPRLLMGVFFGYLLVWTGSIWVPVFAHVLNNSIVVVTAAITDDSTAIFINPSESSIFIGDSIGVILSLILTTAFFYFFRNSIFKLDSSWQKKQLPPISET
ncbi:MAG: CPBP family intramembrane metalloprotease [Muribaculaceae bacterium]|nr:CPBP family intramembrane metalloprotease [Muribaculaceae bacterium]